MISDFYNTAEKQWVKIITVDPRSRRIEAALKDRTPVQISLYEISTGFRWPQEGEWWLIHRENREWFLRAPLQREDANVKVEDLDPGDTLIGAEGAKVVIEGTLANPNGDEYILETDERLTDSRAPTGPAGGDLTGEYPDPTLAMRVIRGAVNADATTARGNGFASSKWLGLTGFYLIQFDDPMDDPPVVTVTSGINDRTVGLISTTASLFVVEFDDLASVPTNTAFQFIAISI